MTRDAKTSAIPAPASSSGFDRRVACALVGLLASDAVLLLLAFAGLLDGAQALLAHVAVVLATGALVPLAGGADRTPWVLSLLLVLVAGPLAALGILVLAATALRGAPAEDVLQDWYDWLSGETRPDATLRLHEAILAGRELRPRHGGPRRFAEMMTHGTLLEKQTLLGHVGLRYHPDYFPLIQMALRSPQAGVRAQAAAVFVKLTDQMKRRLQAERAAGRRARRTGDAAAMLSAATALLDCVHSRFLDPVVLRETLGEALGLCRDAEAASAPADAVDVLRCRLIAAGAEDDGTLSRLVAAAPAPETPLAMALAQGLATTGRHDALHALLGGGMLPLPLPAEPVDLPIAAAEGGR